ncbi:hypothetical protein KA005_53820 [bacterium]|nr:hypothetical protein [bacterium]
MKAKEYFRIKKEIRKYKDLLVHEEAYLRQVWQVVQSASLSDVSTSGQKLLKQLDQDRREHQLAIFEASKIAGRVCAECKGVCCSVKEEEESHYHAIDFWLRRYTESPLPHQDLIQVEHPITILPRSLFKTILREIRDPVGNAYYFVRAASTVKKIVGIEQENVKKRDFNPISYNPIPKKKIPCMYLSERGCVLDPPDRSIVCIIHTCYAFREALDILSLKVIAGHMEGLRKTHNDVLQLLKKEGKIGRYSGWTRLATPILSFGTPSIKHIRRMF